MCGYDILILISLTQLRSCMPLVNTVVANTFHRSYFLSTQEFLPSISFSSCCPQHITEIRTSSTFRTMWQHIIELTKCQRAGIVKMPPLPPPDEIPHAICYALQITPSQDRKPAGICPNMIKKPDLVCIYSDITYYI